MVLAVVSGLEAVEGCPDGFLELVEQSIPRGVGDADVMAKLLNPQIATPQLSAAFDRQKAQTAVGDKLAIDRTTCPSRSSEEDGEGKEDCTFRNDLGSALRLKLDLGKIAYLNPERSFEAGKLQNNEITSEQALKTSQEVLAAFGVPGSEINVKRAVVRELNVAGRGTRSTKPHDKLRAEVHVLLPRAVSGIPVFDSEAKTAIDARGQVARLHIKWPDFQLAPDLSAQDMLSRDEVIRLVDTEISKENMCRSLSRVRAFIAYVPARELTLPDQGSDERDSKNTGEGYMPALVVYAAPNEPKEDSGEIAMAGQQLAVPLLRSSSKEQ
jgi:hypothetical protein